MSTYNSDFIKETQPGKLSMFSLPPYQTAVERIYFHDVRPISQLSSGSPIEFTISSQNGMEYIDTARSYMYVKLRIVHSDGSVIPANEYFAPINLTLQSLFSGVDVNIQGKLITPNTGNYPYKAMINTLLKYGNEVKNSYLTTQMWEKDTSGHMDDNDAKTGKNSGLLRRGNYFNNSKSVELAGPIMHDIFSLNKYILNSVALTVKFYRTTPEFLIMSDTLSPNYKIDIEEMILRVCKIQVSPAIIYAHAQALQKTNAQYVYTNTEVKMMSLAQGLVNFTWDNVFVNSRANKLVVGFVNSKAVSGSYNLNPYNFQGYDLSQISVSVDGLLCSGQPMRINFENKQSLDIFMGMYFGTGKWRKNEGCDIDRNDINGGYALYVFDIEPYFDEGGYLTLKKQGNVRIDVTFAKSLPHPVTCIVYSEKIGYMQINAAREVLQD